MSRCVIAGLVLLLSATSVVGTGGEWLRHWYIHREKERDKLAEGAIAADDSPADCATECVSQQELAAVKAEVNQLHSQLHYWQNVTVNILKDQCSSFSNGTYSFGLNSLAWLKHWTCSKLQLVNLALRQRSWYLLCSIYPRAVSDWHDAYLLLHTCTCV